MPAAHEAPHDAPARAKLSKSDQADMDALNASIDRMRTFTAPDPYILTIPQDVEPRYHHAYQYQATQWLHQAPFEWKEAEYTQYQTYVYHEHGKDMYVLHNSQPKEEREAAVAKSKPATGANTPNAGPKKKISLNAYKKKQTGAATSTQQEAPAVKQAEPPVKQAAVKGPVERVKAETEQVLAAVEEAEDASVTVEQPVKNKLKWKRDDKGDAPENNEAQAPPAASDEEPATKKARTTSSPATTAPSQRAPSPLPVMEKAPEKASTPAAQPEDAGLPPRLSPLQCVEDLPARLSPTIPANMEATLKAREQLKASSSDVSAPGSANKNGTLTPPKAGDGVTKRKSPIPRNAFRANSSSPAVRSDAEERAKPAVTSAPQRTKTPELSQDEEIAVGRALKATKQERMTMIVKLKYKKHQREAVRRILKMRPNSARTATPQPPPMPPKPVEEPKPEKPIARRRDPTAKGVAQKIGPPAKKQEDKSVTPEKRPVVKDAASEERPARSKQPEIKRYEPPGRRKDSTVDAVSEESLGKRKRVTEERPSRSDEPPPKRREASIVDNPSQEPPAKRQKVPERQQAESVQAPPDKPHGPSTEVQTHEPVKQKKLPDEQPKLEEPPTSRNHAHRAEPRTEEPPADRKKVPAEQSQPEETSQRRKHASSVEAQSEESSAKRNALQDVKESPSEEQSSQTKQSEQHAKPKVVPDVKEPPSKEQASHTKQPEELAKLKVVPDVKELPKKEPLLQAKQPEGQSNHHESPPIRKRAPSVEARAEGTSAKPKVVPDVKEPPRKVPSSQSKQPEEQRANAGQQRANAGQQRANAGQQRANTGEPSTKAKDASDENRESPIKRKKLPEVIETRREPGAPVQLDLQSPSLLSSTQRSQQVTPITLRKDHLSTVAMVRETSAEGSVRTPSSGASSTPGTVNGITSQPNGVSSKTASSQSGVKTATQMAWETEQKRLEGLGRELKHAATAHLNKLRLVQSDPNGLNDEQKLAAVKSVESLLAYFLAFTSADEAALAAEPKQSLGIRNWLSLHGFFTFVKRNCEATPLLFGLACHLGVVFSAHILEISQNLGKQAITDVAAETNATMLFKNARDADVKLDCEVLQENFSRSWNTRTRVLASSEQLTPGEFKGEYKLPLGVQTTPIRAARAGHAMLEEWIGKEKVDYELKLRL